MSDYYVQCDCGASVAQEDLEEHAFHHGRIRGQLEGRQEGIALERARVVEYLTRFGATRGDQMVLDIEGGEHATDDAARARGEGE